MTEENIKELLSRRYLELVANRCGYACTNPACDYGVDLEFTGFVGRVENGRTRYMQSDKRLDVQLKATTTRGIYSAQDFISFPLERKNYNDLVHRRNGVIPLLLVVLVLPADQSEWITLSPDELIFRQCAYWYLPEVDATPILDQERKSVRISQSNVVTMNFFSERFTAHYGTSV